MKGGQERTISQPPGFQGFSSNRDVTPDSLITGALESAFYEMVICLICYKGFQTVSTASTIV